MKTRNSSNSSGPLRTDLTGRTDDAVVEGKADFQLALRLLSLTQLGPLELPYAYCRRIGTGSSRPRGRSLVRGLEASVRDPAWFLARQWQIGEFLGEDAGSPATVTLRSREGRFTSWTARGGDAQAYDGEAPLKALVEAEATSPDWMIAVELGQMLKRLLEKEGASTAAIQRFEDAYKVPALADLTPTQNRDAALVRFI